MSPVRSLSLALAASLALAVPAAVRAQSLSVGNPAPPLSVSKWVKGEKFETLDPDQTYVVEFWATWCGPCRVSIPHLTELQHKYKDKVKFIGVSVWEQDQDNVAPFVKKMGDKMDYSVALDDVPDGEKGSEGKMPRAWMKASESDGIPTAFIVSKGKIAWIGHPMEMDKPLAEVTSGDFDVSAAAGKLKEQKAQQQKLLGVLQKLRALGRDADPKDQLAVIDKAIEATPGLGQFFAQIRFPLLLRADREKAAAYATSVVDKATKDDAQVLNAIAWSYVDPEAREKPSKDEVKIALKAARKADEFTNGENGAILDTLAKAYFDSGQPAKALECQEKAVKLLGDQVQQDPGITERLEQYRKAVKDKTS